MLRRYIHAFLLIFFILATGAAALAQAGMPELVGVLQLVLEDEVAKHIELSDEQRAAIQKVVDDRETEGLSLALRFKDQPPAEAAAGMASYRDETVALGLRILNDEQREKLAKLEVVQANPLYALPSARSGRRHG